MGIVFLEDVVLVLGGDVAAPEASLAKLVIGTSVGLVFETSEIFGSAGGTSEAVVHHRLRVGYAVQQRQPRQTGGPGVRHEGFDEVVDRDGFVSVPVENV